MARGEGKDRSSAVTWSQFITPQFVPFLNHALGIAQPERLTRPLVIAAVGSTDFMTVFKANFIVGLLVGVALAAATPIAGMELFATTSVPAKASTPAEVFLQTVNRDGKSDRLHTLHNAIGGSPGAKTLRIPEGCDPAFSPLSRGAASNFSSRCLA